METRKELEINVTAVNTVLKGRVQSMSLVELLRNCHPLHRSDFASRLLKENALSRIEAGEFTKIVGV